MEQLEQALHGHLQLHQLMRTLLCQRIRSLDDRCQGGGLLFVEGSMRFSAEWLVCWMTKNFGPVGGNARWMSPTTLVHLPSAWCIISRVLGACMHCTLCGMERDGHRTLTCFFLFRDQSFLPKTMTGPIAPEQGWGLLLGSWNSAPIHWRRYI